jgi:hypothetical protein
MTQFFKLAVCLAWAGVVISSATPSDALVRTSQTGSYANCRNDWDSNHDSWCLTTNYVQYMKFMSTACSSGGCSSEFNGFYTESTYGSGRKKTTSYGLCGAGSAWRIYGLGSCSC